MSRVTRQVSNRIAIVFDFDETLTPRDSFDVLLEDCGFDANAFVEANVKPLIAKGWEKYLARAYALVQASRDSNSAVTYQQMAETGANIELYEGIAPMFKQLSALAQDIYPAIEVEYYLISGGFVDIPRNTPIASEFKALWGCEFEYSEAGTVAFLKRQMTHTEKTRYLYYLSRGIEASKNEKDLIYNYPNIPDQDLFIPLDQVIYVGDGASDVPCFDVMRQFGGTAIGIYAEESNLTDWEHLEEIRSSQRLSSLVPAGYTADSPLMRSLQLSVEYIAKRIALNQLSERKR